MRKGSKFRQFRLDSLTLDQINREMDLIRVAFDQVDSITAGTPGSSINAFALSTSWVLNDTTGGIWALQNGYRLTDIGSEWPVVPGNYEVRVYIWDNGESQSVTIQATVDGSPSGTTASVSPAALGTYVTTVTVAAGVHRIGVRFITTSTVESAEGLSANITIRPA